MTNKASTVTFNQILVLRFIDFKTDSPEMYSVLFEASATEHSGKDDESAGRQLEQNVEKIMITVLLEQRGLGDVLTCC